MGDTQTLDTLTQIEASMEAPPEAPAEVTPEAPQAAEAPAQPEAPAAEAPAPEATPETGAQEEKVLSLLEVAKSRGLTDDVTQQILEIIENGGNVAAYMEGLNENIEAIAMPDLLLRHIDEKYAMLSEEEREVLYQDKLDDYRQDPDLYSEEEIRKGAIKMKADLHGYKEELKQRQAQNALTKANSHNGDRPGADEIKAFTEQVTNSQVYKELKQKGTMTVGEGNEIFNMDVDVDKVTAYLTDLDAYAQAYKGPDGKPDVKKDLRVAAYALDPISFEKKLIEHGRKLALLQQTKDLGREQVPGTEQQAQGGEPDPVRELADMMANW